jgi:Ti-type conjugative transfer relaxase TraA
MAIYHFSAKVISRANGSSALAAAAYRSASRLYDERLDRDHNFSNKAGVVHSEVMLPDGAPEAWHDREKLWNAVEAAELRKDAQLAREVEFAIPRELDQAEGIRLARDFVQRAFVDRGMIADLNLHWDIGADGEPKPHAHVMLTTREVGKDGFGAKVRDWNRTELLASWREAWAEHVNTRLAELDIGARVDHRSLEAQGVGLEPQHKIGPAAARMAGEGLESERLAEHAEIARANGERLLAKPSLALDAITRTQATFTTRDLAMFVHRHSEGKEQFDHVMAAVRGAPELVALGRDGRGEERFTSREMIETEQRLKRTADLLASRASHRLSAASLERVASAAESGLQLHDEQQAALNYAIKGSDLVNVIGFAGTGKSTMLGVAREAWEAAGFRVTGAALSGIAAEGLEHGSGITSRTLASLEHQWRQGNDTLTDRDVLVIDEAGMIGTRQMEHILGVAAAQGAKVVLVGDPQQLQAIEAGAAFRNLSERHGAIEITAVRRQREDWQRDATRQLATGRTADAINSYNEAGHVHAAETRYSARAMLVDRWDRGRQEHPNETRLILTHTRDEVAELNALARVRLRERHELGVDFKQATSRGERLFASGDRVMFLRNERSLGVKNGSLGTVQSVSAVSMALLMDDGRSIAFDLTNYADVDHGYAATIHKSQGVTVDRTHVLATPGLDRHATYVALSRHRDRVDLHYGRDDFEDQRRLVRALSRERAKDMASDYQVAASDPDRPRNPFAGIRPRQWPPADPQPTAQRSIFAGIRINANPDAFQERTPLDRAVERFARATADVLRTTRGGHEPLIHQRNARDAAAKALDAVQPDAARDLDRAFAAAPALVDEAAKGRSAAAIRAMQMEAELRIDTGQRADRFVAQWQQQVRRYQGQRKAWDYDAAERTHAELTGMVKGLERDPQLESLLRSRRVELGLKAVGGASLSHDLTERLGLSRSIGIGF